MANNCDFELAQGIAPDCDNPQTRGLEREAIIINRADIDFSALVRDNTNPAIVSTLALKTGTKGYQVLQIGATPYSGTNTAMATGTYRNKFTKTVSFAVLDHCPDTTKNVIDNLANGVFVMVVKNNSAGSDGKGRYEIIGLDGGLRATEMPRDPNSEETDGAWVATLQETAPTSGTFLYDTDEATTEAAFQALLTTTP